MRQYDAWSWHGNMLLIELMRLATILNEVGLNQRFKFKLHMWLFKCHLIDLTWSAGLTSSNMHKNAINRFLEFFWSFFIYKLFSSELRLILYDFYKFWLFSEINKSFLIYFKSQKIVTASAWRQDDVISQQRLVQVKPDVWGPHVSDTEVKQA